MKREERKQNKFKKEINHMNYKVIKPMLMEIKIKDELISRLKTENDMNVKDLKMINTIIRIPKMTTEF